VFGQLVAALVAVELVFAAVDLRRFFENLPGDLTEVTVRVDRGVADIFVPSIATTPTDAKPARLQRPRTPLKTSPSACSWRRRNSAIVE
jgi:hypothetical protein